MVTIRPAWATDCVRLQQIELATHEQFRVLGHHKVAEDPPDPVEVLAEYAELGRSWVAVDDDNEVVGYILVDVVDHLGHIEQVTVHPDHQGEGVGRALIEMAESWARRSGMPAVTLTTFSEVPWNKPLYEHLGFRILEGAEIGPQLRAVQEHEVAKGFGPEGRVAMRLDLGPEDRRPPDPARGGDR
jgi:GNAT superfamily N-acetyltransferase